MREPEAAETCSIPCSFMGLLVRCYLFGGKGRGATPSLPRLRQRALRGGPWARRLRETSIENWGSQERPADLDRPGRGVAARSEGRTGDAPRPPSVAREAE